MEPHIRARALPALATVAAKLLPVAAAALPKLIQGSKLTLVRASAVRLQSPIYRVYTIFIDPSPCSSVSSRAIVSKCTCSVPPFMSVSALG